MLSAAVRYTTALLSAAVLTLLMQSTAIAAQILLFDQAHDQRFVAEKEGPLQLSSFAAILQQEGFAVKSGTERFTEEYLKGVSVVVVSGAFAPLDKAETDALCGFVARGGKVAVMLHVPSPVADLLHRLDVDFTNYVLFEQKNLIDNDPRNFQIRQFSSHPLTASLTHFSLYGGWALMNTGESAQIVAETSQEGWVDLDGDKKLTKGDAVQSFGVVVAGTSGTGKFVIFGDDAIFQNKFLDEQNRQLALNLAKWLK
jgi:hypothetical protein